jgi:PGAP1-like protein
MAKALPTSPGPTRRNQPIILIRGFGGLGVEDEKKIAYQGFNDGTVYPHKRGENYIYEGLILRLMKSNWQYQDATNVIGYYGEPVKLKPSDIPVELQNFDQSFFSGDKIIIDPAIAVQLLKKKDADPLSSLWVFRYYDLNDRKFPPYGKALVRLIEFVRELVALKDGVRPKLNIIAHSMGGLIVREAVQSTFPSQDKDPKDYINKIVTLGTPHRGISFQVFKDWIRIDSEKELESFNPKKQEDQKNKSAYVNFAKHFPPERVLTVVGTNYRTYGPTVASWLNRAFSVAGEFGPNYNRSDGLVKQISAQLPGAPRTFVHKCHGGPDSLVTSREAFEVATRFFFGNIKVQLRLLDAKVMRGGDLIGKSEFFFGVSIKPRGVDFDLFHQSAEAENCYGPFRKDDFSDADKGVAFPWAGKDRLIWEGWLNTDSRAPRTDKAQQDKGSGAMAGGANDGPKDIVMRLDVYVGERDLFGLGFSDNVIFRKQYYVRALFDDLESLKLAGMELHIGDEFRDGQKLERSQDGWSFTVADPSFKATMQISYEVIKDGAK